MDTEFFSRSLGFPTSDGQSTVDYKELRRVARLQLMTAGYPASVDSEDGDFINIAGTLLKSHQARVRLLHDVRCPADERIENFLSAYCADLELEKPLRLPSQTLILDRHGVARELSIPSNGHHFKSDLVESYRVRNGVLHNPRHDRRTTRGTFHVCEGGLPIPGDKKVVPKETFARLFQIAMRPPAELLRLPFTANDENQAETFVSLLLRPLVCPEVQGFCSSKSLEVRFFAPGNLVSNLDFVESIFGNGGDPYLAENDSALDIEHWTGHTGCVILATHLGGVTKKEVGLPCYDRATERQRRDGMCWKDDDELYNEGTPFKLTCRDESGVVVTLISDNYFGYCKKEVKTQISYAANMYGNTEEEHAGGVIAFPSYNLGDVFDARLSQFNDRTMQDVLHDYADLLDPQPEGHAIDKEWSDLVFIPENAKASIHRQEVYWKKGGEERAIPLLPGKVYMTPSGYRLHLEKHPAAPSWRLIGTRPEGTFCHKPCTVSGGGKSEISKSLVDYMLYGPIFVSDFEQDLKLVKEVFERDYSDRWLKDGGEIESRGKDGSRPVLSRKRSLGSVVKLLTPSEEYNDEFNEWLANIPDHIYAMAFIIKRFYNPEWEDNWQDYFNVDIVNGVPGHELKIGDRKLVGTYLRVGLHGTHSWRTYKCRQDFAASQKVQTEDDISASVVVPRREVQYLAQGIQGEALKFVSNCEYRLFQRPDDAIHRGLDKQTELDLSQPDNFISNFEPLPIQDILDMTEKAVDFDAFTAPMQDFLRSIDDRGFGYVVCSAEPRKIGGLATRNPRYLQNRPDLVDPKGRYYGEMGMRLRRAIPVDQFVPVPVTAVMPGRRNNPPDKGTGIRSLAVYNPIHYQELPELFMDFICSLTGKSPSTTGYGSEGALTKGPFNALLPITDLNNALVSYILTGLPGFSSAAGFVGPERQVDHDISLLIPEIWCRLFPEERTPEYLIENGLLEKLENYEYNGVEIPQSRLGYRITSQFVRRFLGRIFDNPDKVFDERILKPEIQDPESYADGILYITDAQRDVAQTYLKDGSVDDACPPLKALLHIMADGNYEGLTEYDAGIREMFTLEYLLESGWYHNRLKTRQEREVALWKRHVDYLEIYISDPRCVAPTKRMNLKHRLEEAKRGLARVQSAEHLKSLIGTLGADPMKNALS